MTFAFLHKVFGMPASAGARSDRGVSDIFRDIAENSADVIFCMRLDETATFVSPSCMAVLGWTPEELLQMGPASIVHPDDLPTLSAKGVQLQAGAIAGEVTEYRVRHKDGHYLWVQSNSRLSNTSPDGRADLVVVLRDITDRKLLEERLANLASTDGLTGLANRRSFDATLDLEWQRALNSDGQLSLLLIDIDFFKAFNDRYGHIAGDDCLRAVARSLIQSAQDFGGFAARYGGEEMALILANQDPQEAAAIAEEVRLRVLSLALVHHHNAYHGGRLTVSIGVATALARAGGSMSMPESLLLAADIALYKAKEAGRNRSEVSLLLAAGRA